MFKNAGVAGSWPGLLHRLEKRDVWASWVSTEPALAGLQNAAALEAALAPGVSRHEADAVLGALVRLAAADAGDDPDALLVVVHLLADGVAALARKIAHRTPDSLTVVVGELTCQIRRFPWRRRTRSIAANLLLDTKNALWVGEYRPLVDVRRPENAVLIDPITGAFVFDGVDATQPGAADDCARLELMDLMRWAAASRVAPADELRMLWEVERQLDAGETCSTAARGFGISESTLYRLRRRTLAALRAHRASYLAAVA